MFTLKMDHFLTIKADGPLSRQLKKRGVAGVKFEAVAVICI